MNSSVANQLSYLSRTADAETAIRQTGQRLTQPRMAVLACLLVMPHAASHLDVARTLAVHHALDRVTVYRVLEWLVTVGIAHRIAGDDRVWRFRVNTADTELSPLHTQHAHFTCDACGQTFCLDMVPEQLNFALPAGFRSARVDLKFAGRCTHCA